MKRINVFVILLCGMIAFGCSVMPEVEMKTHACATFPAGGRAAACACAMHNKGYVLGGRDANGTYHNDLWQYNPVDDSWKQLSTIPGDARVNAVIIGYQGCLYAGLGYAHKGAIYTDSDYLRDWWRYNPTTNQWDSLAPYPSGATVSPVLYVSSDRIYAIYGSSDTFTREINWYDPATDTWHQEEDSQFRALSAFKGAGAEIQEKHYFGLGYNGTNLTQWYQVNLEKDEWSRCTPLPGKGRTCSAFCATDNFIYVLGGRYFAGEMTGGEVFDDMIRYDPITDSWATGGAMPSGPAENLIAFAINEKVYFGLGETPEGQFLPYLNCIDE